MAKRTGKAGVKTYRGFEALPREGLDAAADRIELYQSTVKSAGFRELAKLMALAEKLDAGLAAFLEDHGPGSGSPLARYVRRYDAGTWADVEHMHYCIRRGVADVTGQLPALPAV